MSDLPPGARLVLPPEGFVRLDGSLASDLDVVQAARVSFRKRSELENGQLPEADQKLIGYLMREEHGSPFEHNFFRFQVRAPIFVFREWHRHRVGISINEESGRYVELREESWVPGPQEIRVRQGKPGHYTYTEASPELGQEAARRQERAHQEAFREYRWQIDQGVAPEVARNVLPLGTYSEMIWSCNARSLMHFLHLRLAPEAQREIRLYAEALLEFFREEMPVTCQAFEECNFQAP